MCVVAGVQTGQVVADVESADRYHRPDDGCARQPLFRPDDRHFHLRSDGHAAVRSQLPRGGVRLPSALELRGLPTLVHDRVSRAVR